MRRIRPRPVRITSVPPRRASAAQSGGSACSSSSLPSTTVRGHRALAQHERDAGGRRRGERGRDAGHDADLDRPPRAARRASSPPREATNGSPLLSRTTSGCARPSSTSSALTSGWGSARRPGRAADAVALGAGRREREDRRPSTGGRRRPPARARSSSAAATVSRPGSPGPAPTRWTVIARPRRGTPRATARPSRRSRPPRARASAWSRARRVDGRQRRAARAPRPAARRRWPRPPGVVAVAVPRAGSRARARTARCASRERGL